MVRMAAGVCGVLAAAAFGGTAFAGNLEPAPEPSPIAMPAAPAGMNWGGFYAGIQLGHVDVDPDGGVAGDNSDAVGAHLGYRWDFGRTVAGMEIDFGAPDLEFNGEDVDSVFRVKGQYGYDFGRTLAYGTVGLAPTDTGFGDETGLLVGAGLDYMLTDTFMLGGEVIYHDFDEIGNTGIGAEATTVSVRASFRF